jgi:hypothetical protein
MTFGTKIKYTKSCKKWWAGWTLDWAYGTKHWRKKPSKTILLKSESKWLFIAILIITYYNSSIFSKTYLQCSNIKVGATLKHTGSLQSELNNGTWSADFKKNITRGVLKIPYQKYNLLDEGRRLVLWTCLAQSYILYSKEFRLVFDRFGGVPHQASLDWDEDCLQ